MGKAALLCFGLTLLAWARPVVTGGPDAFAFDDREAILANPVVRGALPARAAWRRDYWHHLGDAGHYRPTATLLLALDYRLYGADARGYHLTSALLHAGAAVLLLLLLRELGAAPRVALAAGLLFGLHPALADVAAWISGRTSSASVLAGAAALLLLARPIASPIANKVARLAVPAAGVLLFLALAAKEDAVVFLPAAVLVGATRGRRRLGQACLAAAGALALYLALRTAALGAPLPSAPHAPLAATPLGERLLFGGRAVLEGLRLGVLPGGYPPSYRRAPGFATDAPPGAWAALGLALLLLLLVLAAARWRRAADPWGRVQAAALALAVLAWLPFVGLVPAGEVFAPRFLYLPLFLGAASLAPLLARAPRVLAVGLVAAAVVGAWSRSEVYTGLVPWSRAVLAEVPHDVGAWNTLGLGLEAAGEVDPARAAWERALALDPDYGRAWSNLGRLELAAGDRAAARRSLVRAVEAGPGNAVAYANLASLLLADGELEGAIGGYRRAVQLAPGLHSAWRGLARALAAAGLTEEARFAATRALELAPDDPRTRALEERLGP